MALWIAIAFCVSSVPVTDPVSSTTTIFIVRHAEKDADGQLSEAGIRRAKALSRFLANQNISAVYSTDYARTLNTAKPTAIAAGHKVQTYSPRTTQEWFAGLKSKHAGQNILIVGHSNTVVPLVNGLGAKMTYEIGELDYQNLFIVAVTHATAQAVRINYGEVRAIAATANHADVKRSVVTEK